MPRGRALLISAAVAVAAVPRGARADGAALGLVSPRAVGRAGAAVVSDDGAGAIVLNPAALARREARRAQLGIAVVDDDARYDAGAGPIAIERGSSTVYPVIGGAAAVGPVVFGLALLDDAALAREFPQPTPGQPIDDVEQLFPQRYAGLAAAHHRSTAGAGVSWRATEWLAIGGAVTWSRVSHSETRRLWAGFAGRDVVGGAGRDVTLALSGRDGFVPGGVLGVLAAPVDVPIELGASITGADTARLSGDAAAIAGNPGAAPSVEASSPAASIEVSSPLILRTGARWLGERWIVEVAGELALFPRRGAAGCRGCADWSIEGITVVDETGARAPVSTVRSQRVVRAHGAGRLAADVELVPGFLWLTAGYAYQSAATPADRLSPAAADLGGHTAAIGAELSTDGITVTLGVARTFTPATAVDDTRLTLDNPFEAGTAATGLGTTSLARDVVALTAELEL